MNTEQYLELQDQLREWLNNPSRSEEFFFEHRNRCVRIRLIHKAAILSHGRKTMHRSSGWRVLDGVMIAADD